MSKYIVLVLIFCVTCLSSAQAKVDSELVETPINNESLEISFCTLFPKLCTVSTSADTGGNGGGAEPPGRESKDGFK